MSGTTVRASVSGSSNGILTLELANPPVNCLSAQLREDLVAALAAVSEPDSTIRVVILRGANHRFSAGGDIVELARKSNPEADRQLHESFAEFYASVRDCPVPVIAAIERYAMGGGLELALCCDIRYVTPETRLAASGANMGLVESAHTLPVAIGPSYAAELLFTGHSIDGREAARIGLATRCVGAAELDTAVADLAEQIASRAPGSIRASKEVLNLAGIDAAAAAALAREDWLRLRASRDHNEALTAFGEKRSPIFRGV